MPKILPLFLSIFVSGAMVIAAALGQHSLSHPLNTRPLMSKDFLGNSPLTYCNESRPTDLFWIDKIDVRPEHLYIDDIFTVTLQGYFTSTILTNSTWTSTARYETSNDSEIWTQPFCRLITNIEQDPSSGSGDQHQNRRNERGNGCPPKRGLAFVHMEGWVWDMFIVPGNYFFRFDAVNGDGRRIYCLETNIRLDYKHEDHSIEL
ncbi:MAG: hypothetical protein Q9195_007765 [Heterodermia aff. obscurata]